MVGPRLLGMSLLEYGLLVVLQQTAVTAVLYAHLAYISETGVARSGDGTAVGIYHCCSSK